MGRPVPKEEVRRLLDALPDEASYEDIQYHIYVQQKIDHGLEASERGDFIADEDIERRIARWAAPLLRRLQLRHRVFERG